MIKIGSKYICKEDWTAYECNRLYHSFKKGEVVRITLKKSEGEYPIECNEDIYLKVQELENNFLSFAEFREQQIKTILDEYR